MKLYLNFAYLIIGLLLLTLNTLGQDLVRDKYNGEKEITASKSVTLTPGFYAPSGSNVRIYVSPSIQNCELLVSTPSRDQNYILTKVFRTHVNKNTINDIRTSCEENQSIQYFDGLGRLSQTITVQGSPNGQDVIQPTAYDALGRENIKYLPYTTISNGGAYRADALQSNTGQAAFYNSPPTGVIRTSTPFSQTIFESNPLNRVIEQGAPGVAWQPVLGGNTGHTLKTDFDANAEKDVKMWTMNANGNGAKATYYGKSELYKTMVQNENWVNTDGKSGNIDEFKDLEGRMVLKRIWETDTKSLSTYYIYDDFGSLRYILPPAINENGLNLDSFEESDLNFNEFIYGYHYDERKRVVEKKIPGVSHWDNMIYNELDQLILTQDAKQHNNGQWLFNKYDAFGRVVVIGLYSDASSRASLQAIVDNQTTLWEKRTSSGIGYDNSSFPQTIAYYHNINYYDDYNFPDNSFGQPNGPNQVSSERTRGLLTGTMITKLGSDEMLLTVKYYDDEGRVLQSKSKNHLGGTDIVDNFFNFSGELITSVRNHTVNGVSTTIANRFEYGHTGRKINAYENINNQGEILLSKLDYNEIAQVKSKKLHSSDQGNTFIQTIDYSYNERGWLTGINDPGTISKEKVFGMALNYANDGAYNGNISSLKWQTLVPAGLGLSQTLQTYKYDYDKLNRLKKTSYDAPGVTDKFNEELSYDLMGNIINLKRKNSNGGNYLNDLSYNYIQSNQSGNKLWAVTDLGTAGQSSNYTYDDNGNQKTNSYVGITNIEYNYLNLPQSITKQSTGEVLNFVYDAGGSKLRKEIGSQTTDYVGGIQYSGNRIDFIMNDEGRAVPGDRYKYEYFLKDHLGNTRAVVKQDGSIIQVQDYYAFGLEMNPGNSLTPSPQNNYKYNGKEKQTELGLNQYDYKARFYDPVIARFGGIDKLSSSYPYKSPYDYAENRPINGIDFDGLEWAATYDNYGKIHINVNTNFSFDVASLLPKNVTVSDYKAAINRSFNDIFIQSSGGKVSGSVTYNGGSEQALGQVVPGLDIYAGSPSLDGKYRIGGQTTNQFSGVNIYNIDGSIKSPNKIAWDASHELMHTLRVDHPFERTQGSDTKLIHEGGKNYSTTNTTDPNISYNIMNYGMIEIDGKKLSDLWDNRRTLTPDQIKLILNEINLQMHGSGISNNLSDYEKYWNPNNWPGNNVPIK